MIEFSMVINYNNNTIYYYYYNNNKINKLAHLSNHTNDQDAKN